MSRAAWRMELGAAVMQDQGVRFRVWAPRAKSMAVRIVAPRDVVVPMVRGDGDVYEAMVPGISAGADYFFVLDGERERPDPRSRWQPRGVHGPSRVVDPSAFAWNDAGWRGRALSDLVIYELHTGTFTPGGTFDAACSRLSALAELGVTAIELMPVAEFPGARNWGYDGVDLFAPHSAYGGPSGLKRLVDACHRAGLAVIVDVVYNHLGPEGNYLAETAPYFTDRYRTPWGSAVNFDGPGSDGVRAFVIDNALYWLVEYHADGLRLDAIHGIFDFSARHVLEELASELHAEAERLGRRAHVIAESDLNDARVIAAVESGGMGLDAQWSDDFHHALHTLLTGDRRGYFSDFGSIGQLGKAIAQGFVYDGCPSAWRRRRHGNSSAACLGEQLVVCTQNHDQIANGSGGMRQASRMSFDQQKLAAVALLTGPNTPMLFMGQEWGETAPFHYFTSHGDANLAKAVREGRRAEFSGFGWEREFLDPQAEATFEQCRIDPSRATTSPHAELLCLYGDILRLRRRHPCLGAGAKHLVHVQTSESPRWMVVRRDHPAGGSALLLFNFEPETLDLPVLEAAGPSWKLLLCTQGTRYGGQPSPAQVSSFDAHRGALAAISCPGHAALIYLRSDSP